MYKLATKCRFYQHPWLNDINYLQMARDVHYFVGMYQHDIREYSDNELSLQFYNTETLYRQLQYCFRPEQVTALADEYFISTNEQMEVLLQDWQDKDPPDLPHPGRHPLSPIDFGWED